MTKTDVYEKVSERITEALDKGTVPWRKPWSSIGGPRNILGKKYRGINIFLLELTAAALDYGDPRWGTFKAMKDAAVAQAKRDGREIIEEKVVNPKTGREKTVVYEIIDGERVPFRGGVRQGEKGTEIILWKPVPKKKTSDEEKPGSYLLLRSYYVFNATQCDGVPTFDSPVLQQHERREAAQEIIDGYEDGPEVDFGFRNRAYYDRVEDKVCMPNLEQFESADAFYSTTFHELVHSTGSESRLARKFGDTFGDDPYSREELVAEMGAAMLAALSGVENDQQQIERSAAYVEHWSQEIKDEPKLIVQAAAAAQKAADRILGTSFEKPVEAPETALVAS